MFFLIIMKFTITCSCYHTNHPRHIMGKDANGNSILGGIVVKINLLRSAFSHLWQQPEKIPPQQDTQTPPKQQQENEARGQRIRKGQTPQQAQLRQAKNTSQKKCFPSPLESIKHFLWPAPSLRGWVRKTAGNGSEKAKRHYKPSSGKPKTMRSQPFHTVPKLQLRSRKKNIGKGP